jgi:hypothetical protein
MISRRRKLLALLHEAISLHAQWGGRRARIAAELLDVLLKDRPRRAPAGVIELAEYRKRGGRRRG